MSLVIVESLSIKINKRSDNAEAILISMIFVIEW